MQLFLWFSTAPLHFVDMSRSSVVDVHDFSLVESHNFAARRPKFMDPPLFFQTQAPWPESMTFSFTSRLAVPCEYSWAHVCDSFPCIFAPSVLARPRPKGNCALFPTGKVVGTDRVSLESDATLPLAFYGAVAAVQAPEPLGCSGARSASHWTRGVRRRQRTKRTIEGPIEAPRGTAAKGLTDETIIHQPRRARHSPRAALHGDRPRAVGSRAHRTAGVGLFSRTNPAVRGGVRGVGGAQLEPRARRRAQAPPRARGLGGLWTRPLARHARPRAPPHAQVVDRLGERAVRPRRARAPGPASAPRPRARARSRTAAAAPAPSLATCCATQWCPTCTASKMIRSKSLCARATRRCTGRPGACRLWRGRAHELGAQRAGAATLRVRQYASPALGVPGARLRRPVRAGGRGAVCAVRIRSRQEAIKCTHR
jgi:hypothetical protein